MTTTKNAIDHIDKVIRDDSVDVHNWEISKNYIADMERNYMILHQQMVIMRKAIKVVGNPVAELKTLQEPPEHHLPPGEPHLGDG